jgi:arylsulfatase A-like enzyme
MNTICLVIDRLHAGCLGPYGNTWVQTPAFNRLAAESFVFDQMSIDTPELERLYRSYWQGWHALCPHEPPEGRRSLIAALREAGVTTAILSDERRVIEHPLAVDFDEFIEIDPSWQPQIADDIEQTHLAKCFAELIDWIPSAREPFFLWTHLASLGTAWDAPLDFRECYRDEEDPPVPTTAEPADRFLPEKFDPDELLGVSQAYAGQVSLLDGCLDALFEELDDSALGKDTLLIVTSSRGFPLGEHRRIGPCDESLYGELLHVPLFVRFPDQANASARTQSLVEPADLWASLWQFFELGPRPPSPTAVNWLPIVGQEEFAPRHDRLCMAGLKGERAIRTPAWFLRAAGDGELFVKPDDLFEVNDVANRCLEVVEGLQQARVHYEQSLHSGSLADLPPLEDVLRDGME